VIAPCSLESINTAVKVLRRGGLIVYPTDTLYGLGCNALDEEAVMKVYKAKKRDLHKPLSIAVSDLRMLRKHAHVGVRELRLMEPFLPGPVTFVLRRKALPDVLTGGGEKIGIRIPESWPALKLIISSGVPIVSTSANVSGREPAKTASEAVEQLPEVEIALDAGRLEGPASTVLDLTTRPPRILREGKKPAWEIAAKVEEVYGRV